MPRSWTKLEDDILRTTRRVGWTYAAIAAYLGNRTVNSVSGRCAYLKERNLRNSHIVSPAKVIPPFVFDDRDRRANERAQQDLTGRYFNDPPPSQSALDPLARRRCKVCGDWTYGPNCNHGHRPSDFPGR